MTLTIGKISLEISMLLFVLNLRPTLLAASLKLRNYNVHSKAVYFLNESEDVVYFHGSTFELHCYASCGQDCISQNKIYHNGLPDLIHELAANNSKLILKISNANVKDSGCYQCRRPVWPWKRESSEISGRKFHVQITELSPTKHKTKFLSHGDSIFLPCTVNASNNVYPVPNSVEWWKDDSQLEDGDDYFITQNSSLLVTNFTTDVSYHCVVHWKDSVVSSYNGSYYQLVIVQPAAYHASVYPESVRARVGDSVQFVCVVNGFGQNYNIKWYSNHTPENALPTINHSHVLDIPLVQLNDSGSYYCVVNSTSGTFVSNTSHLQVIETPYIINITSDVLINTSVPNNVTLNCSFTGNLVHTTVHWKKGNLDLTHNTIITNNNIAILSLSIDANMKNFMGSYQCVVKNEVGYVSRTTRILPKGWTSPPRNVKVTINYHNIENCSIIVSWDPLAYDGGLSIHCYKLMAFYGENNSSILGDCLTTTFYSWDGCKFISAENDIEFKITVVDEYKNERSKVVTKRLTLPKTIVNLTVDCTSSNVKANWRLTSYPSSSDHEYCLRYSCNSVEKETCNMDHATHNTTISGVPVNTTCWFIVTVKRTEQNSNNVSCYRPLPSAIIGKVMNQTATKGNTVTFTCQAIGEPTLNISWYLNNDILVNESDKYQITTKQLNYTSSSSILTVKSVESSDVGTYTCYATNGVSTDISSGILLVNVAPNIILPERTEQIYAVTEGDNITCTATGYPVPDIIWLNDDGSVVDNVTDSRIMATGIGNLSNVSISIIVRRKGGTYTCYANNSVGNDTSNVIIAIKMAPFITIPMTGQAYTITEGDNITCTATGYPEPNIEWQNNNGSVVDNVTSSMAVGDGSLYNVSISLIVRRNDGGVYTCYANNSIGNDNYTINIIVQMVPIITITETEQRLTVTEGDKITCTAIAYPVPDIVWLNDDGSVVDKNRTVTGSAMATGVGNIYSVSVSMVVRRNDDGVYTCYANNSVGNDTTTINITVQSTPEGTSSEGYAHFWLLTLLLLIAVILFLIPVISFSFIKRIMKRRLHCEPPPWVLDGFDDKSFKDTPSDTEEITGDNISDLSSIKEYDIEKKSMYEEICFPKGDPVVTTTSPDVISMTESDIMDNSNEILSREPHYYDSSSSSSNTGNSVQTQQHYDSGNPIVDNEVPLANEGCAYNS